MDIIAGHYIIPTAVPCIVNQLTYTIMLCQCCITCSLFPFLHVGSTFQYPSQFDLLLVVLCVRVSLSLSIPFLVSIEQWWLFPYHYLKLHFDFVLCYSPVSVEFNALSTVAVWFSVVCNWDTTAPASVVSGTTLIPSHSQNMPLSMPQPAYLLSSVTL